jgi:hypothetical protein
MSSPTLESNGPVHTYALVSAFLELSRCGGYWCWIVRHCENCGHSHIHGAGPVGEDPRRSLGHRAAHCRIIARARSRGHSIGGYILRDAEPDRTERILAEVQ